ncbi:MAG: VOC family protein, partial [Candidatus Binatia bacterium]
ACLVGGSGGFLRSGKKSIQGKRNKEKIKEVTSGWGTWVSLVKDLERSKKFYTEVVGFKV